MNESVKSQSSKLRQLSQKKFIYLYRRSRRRRKRKTQLTMTDLFAATPTVIYAYPGPSSSFWSLSPAFTPLNFQNRTMPLFVNNGSTYINLEQNKNVEHGTTNCATIDDEGNRCTDTATTRSFSNPVTSNNTEQPFLNTQSCHTPRVRIAGSENSIGEGNISEKQAVRSSDLKFGIHRILSKNNTHSSTFTDVAVPPVPIAQHTTESVPACHTMTTVLPMRPEPVTPINTDASPYCCTATYCVYTPNYRIGDTSEISDTSQTNRTRKRSWSRAVFSNLQRKGLEKRFEIQKYVTKPDRRQLAAMLGLTDAQVKVWFQNRRMKWRHNKETEKLQEKKKSVKLHV